MTVCANHDLENKIVEILRDVRTINATHHFGRQYISSYQIAVEMERRHPQVRTTLNTPLGGAGTGQHDSFSQYIGKELSKRIARDAMFPVEGVFMAHQDMESVTYRRPDGTILESSVTGSGFDLALFRLRQGA